jgi:hypothetical protein
MRIVSFTLGPPGTEMTGQQAMCHETDAPERAEDAPFHRKGRGGRQRSDDFCQ